MTPSFASSKEAAMSAPLRAACVVLLLGGCSLVPDYLRPDAPVPAQWPPATSAPAPAPGAPLAGDLSWREVFRDPALQRLIDAALANNRDLRVAALNIEVARAKLRAAGADLFPTLDASAGLTQTRTGRETSQSVPKAAQVTRSASANLGVTSYEADLFGRLSSLEEAAQESLLATEEGRAATRISLIAEVANAWATLLGDRRLLQLTEETLQTRETSLSLITRSFSHGISSELDVAQAKSAVETARANRARYQRQIEQDKNALALLVGAPLDEATLVGDLASLTLAEGLASGLPSEVLLKRPDIAQAEHSLKSANANIGAARAAFFPSITLSGSAGYASPNLGNLFTAAAGGWSFGPQISVPIFDWGRNEANLDSAKASRDISVAQYEKAIQTAFREVADALAARATLDQQMEAQSALVDATRTSTRLSQIRYDRGVDSYLTVLDSQRSLYAAEQDLVTLQVTRLTNLVTLYKVLGGGRS